MIAEFVDIVTGTPAPTITPTGAEMTLESRSPGYVDGQVTVREVWSGSRAAGVAFFNSLIGKSGVVSINTTETNGGTVWRVTVEVTGASGGALSLSQEDEKIWTIEPIEVPLALAAHPYWNFPYIAEAGKVIVEDIAEIDRAIADGDYPYFEGAYEQWASRYYGHRLAGVENGQTFGLSLRCEFTTDDLKDITDYCAMTNRVVSIGPASGVRLQIKPTPPQNIITIADSFKRIANYGPEGSTSSNPDDVVFESAAYEFLVRVPKIKGPEEGPWAVEFEWWGLPRWSRILYPGGSWDPKGSLI